MEGKKGKKKKKRASRVLQRGREIMSLGGEKRERKKERKGSEAGHINLARKEKEKNGIEASIMSSWEKKKKKKKKKKRREGVIAV